MSLLANLDCFIDVINNFVYFTVKFRIIPINTELKAFGRAIDVYILDPSGRIMKRWLSRQVSFYV